MDSNLFALYMGLLGFLFGWCCRKEKKPGIYVNSLIGTSVDDCKATLPHVNDLPMLRRLLELCEQREHKTRAQVVRRRIRQLEKDRTE